jgi:ATP-dependent protease ClpP protease subunit
MTAPEQSQTQTVSSLPHYNFKQENQMNQQAPYPMVSLAPTMPAPTPDTVYLVFTADVNPGSTQALLAACANLVAKGFQKIYLVLSTPGGSVMHGMTIYHFLRGLPVEVITHNIGNVDSIGNAIFLAGKQRFACKNSTFMFHGVGFNHDSKIRLEEKFLKERLDAIYSDQNRIGAVIEERTKITGQEVKSLFFEAQTKDAVFAHTNGIIDEIRELTIPVGAPVVTIVITG